MYPRQYQDLLNFLDGNPQYLHDMRVRLLSPELIALPEKFAELVGVVAELNANLQAFAEATGHRLASLETDVQTLKTDVNTLKTDVNTLKTDVNTLKTDVAALKGSDTERRARENILNIAKDELDLTRGRVLLARGRETAPQLLESIETAEEQGLITGSEADNVLVADIIIRARRSSDRQYVYGVFEVSRTIGLRDIQRAHDRAGAVARATGEDTIAAVIGETIQPQQQAQAGGMRVEALIPAMFKPEEPGSEETGHAC